jgi:FkbM family methyltransferase
MWDAIPFDEVENAATGRQMVDIGANYGWFGLMFALRGWEGITAFEALPSNAALIRASLCLHPEIADRVKLIDSGLGPVERSDCRAYTKDRDGDSVVCCKGDLCDGDTTGRYHIASNTNFHSVPVRITTLDLEMRGQERGSVGYLKIDVEGFECGIVSGGVDWLSRVRPTLVQAEINVWHRNNYCSPVEFAAIWRRLGYGIGHGNSRAAAQDRFPPMGKPVCDSHLRATLLPTGKQGLLDVRMTALNLMSNDTHWGCAPSSDKSGSLT